MSRLEANLNALIERFSTNRPPREVPEWILPDTSCEFLQALAGLYSQPVTAFEFGSGRSTHVLRSCCTNVVTIEHSADWLEKTESSAGAGAVAARPGDYSCVIPLSVCWSQLRPFHSFDLSRQPEVLDRLGCSQIILIDSPPNPATREHALLLALGQSRQNTAIVVDDVQVRAVHRFVHRLSGQNAIDFAFWTLPIDHGLAIFLKRSRDAKRIACLPQPREVAGQWLRFLSQVSNRAKRPPPGGSACS